MKINDLIVAQPILQLVIKKELPGKLAYALAKNVRLIDSELEDYNRARLKLLADNWPYNQIENKYEIPDPDKPKWMEMHNELIQMETGYKPYTVDISVVNEGPIKWSAEELLALWFIFEGDGAADLAPKTNVSKVEE